MRFTGLLPLFLTALVSVRASSSLTRRTDPNVCASLNTELVVPDLLGVLTAVGLIATCLCQSDIPTFLQTNPVANLAVTVAGEGVVSDILNALVQGAAPGNNCNYPDNSVPQCVNGDPCGFQCLGGTAPPTCECPAGTFSIPGGCQPCPTGQVSDAGATQCHTCDANSIPNAGQTECETCTPGSVSSPGDTTCTSACQAGSFNDGDSCEPCPAGQISAVGATSCDPCGANTIPNSGHTECVPCPHGQSSRPGSSSCRPRHCRPRHHSHSGMGH